MQGIEIHFKKTAENAKKISELAGKIEQSAKSDLSGTVGGLKSVWTGDTGDYAVEKGTKIQERVEQKARNLNKTAEHLNSAANILLQAEEKAKSLFGGR